MGRKPNKKDLTISKYRWEFLRRNLAYKENYFEFKKGNLKTLDFCKKWRLLYAPLDPTKSFEDLYKEAFQAFDKGNKLNKNQVKEYAEHWLSQTLLPTLMFGMPVDCIDRMGEDDFDFSFPLTEKFLNQGILELGIDLNYSKSAILKSFERVLANYKELYESQSSLSLLKTYKLWIKEKGMQKKDKEFYLKRIKELEGRIIKKGKSKKNIEQILPIPVFRKELKHYDDYLRVWDLVEEKKKKKKRWTWQQIAKEVFPDEFKNLELLDEDDEEIALPNPESAITKVKKYYKKADGLINKIQPIRGKQS